MKKKMCIFLAAGMLMAGTALNVTAAEVQPRYTCTNPECTGGYMRSFCEKDYQLRFSGTHKRWPWSEPCMARYYTSFGGFKCFSCGVYGPVGRHDCKEEHESCGMGIYNVCPYNGGVTREV